MANEEEARRFAADYLASLPSSPTSIAPAQPAVVDLGDIDAPAPVGERIKKGIGTAFSPPPITKEAAKNAAILGGASLAAGPAGYIAANEAITSGYAPPGPKNPAPPTAPGNSEAGPLEAPPQDEPPLILNQRGGGMGRMVSPAGLYPQSLTTQAHVGRPVPQEAIDAYGTATAMRLQGAEQMRGANQALHAEEANLIQQRLQANKEAADARLRVEAEKKAMVDKSMAEMRALNEQAGAAIDPNKYWSDRGAGAGVVGAIAIALGEFSSKLRGGPNTAMQLIENGINREVQAQVQNRQLAQHKLGQAQNLYNLHLQNFGDKERAIEATKLGLYDNILAQAEQYRLKHAISADDAAYMDLVGGILEKKGDTDNRVMLQSTDDVNRQYTESWHNAQYAGGGGTPAGKLDGMELIPVPGSDRTGEKNQMIAVPKGVHQKLSEVVGATNTIVGINQEALERIKEIKRDAPLAMKGDFEAFQRVQANRKLLEDLGQRKASYLSSSEGQGVLKEAEFQRAMDDRVLFNDWWKPGANVEKRLQGQNNSVTGAAGRMVQGAGGQHVKMAYTRDKNGALQPTPLFEGKPYAPPVVGPEMGPVKDPRKK